MFLLGMRDSEELLLVPCAHGGLKGSTENTTANALLGLSLYTLLGHKCVFIVAQSQTAKSGYGFTSVILLFIY